MFVMQYPRQLLPSGLSSETAKLQLVCVGVVDVGIVARSMGEQLRPAKRLSYVRLQ